MKIMLIIIGFLILLYLFLSIRRNILIKKSLKTINKNVGQPKQEHNDEKSTMVKTKMRETLIETNATPFVLALFDETDNLRKYGFYDDFRPAYFIEESLSVKKQEELNLFRFIFLFETIDDNLEFLVYDKVLKGYIRYHIDKNIPFDKYEVLTWDGTFVAQILNWYEDCKTDDEILNICNLFGLKYGKQILESIPVELGERYTMEQTSEWIKQTIEKIGGRIK